MPPVVAFVAWVGAAWAAVGAAIVGTSAFAVAAWAALGNILVNIAIGVVLNKLFAPKVASVAQRQASVLELTIGESAREAILGRACTGGTLLDAFNFGADNEWEMVVVALADHRCDALEGYYVNDQYYAFTVAGLQPHADFNDNGSVLAIQFKDGRDTQVAVPALINNSTAGGEVEPWTINDRLNGVAYAVVQYKISEKVWSSGRPRFRFVLRGYPLYDPRLDSTVPGGSGAHRFNNKNTWEWSDNAALCRYAFIRGITSCGQLMVGPGRSAEEAPPEEIIAQANLCDELVALKAGGTEPRYRASAVIRADERWIDVEEHFAATMGGQLVERAGTLGVDAGVAKSVVFDFTDKDLISGSETAYQAKVTRDELVNTVVARFVDIDQLWEESTSPIRRSQEDIDADGEVREETIDLVFVTSPTQAQRIAEIKRRKARLQPTAIMTLGPKYMRIEDGDWGRWTSARRFGGGSRIFEVQRAAHDETGKTQIALKEISTSVFSWNRLVDELDVTKPAYLPAGARPPAGVANFDAAPIEMAGSATQPSVTAILVTFDVPTDPSIKKIKLEYRVFGSTSSVVRVIDPDDGAGYIIDVLSVVDVDYEVRATPVVQPKRDTLTTAWRQVTLTVPLTLPQPPVQFSGYHSGNDLLTFTWSAFTDPTLHYEIRSGVSFDLGRVVARDIAGGSVLVQWPLADGDEQVPFWIKTVHRTGLKSTTATLWIATAIPRPDRNFVITDDLAEEEFPGVQHNLSLSVVGDLNVLELDFAEGASAPRGDYYAPTELIDRFRARAWIEQRASAFINDTPAWEDAGFTWENAGGTWQPELTDPGEATLDSYVAIDLNGVFPSTLIEGFRLNDTTTGAKLATVPVLSEGITFAPAKAANGALTGGTSALWYEVALTQAFSILFDMRLDGAEPSEDKAVMTLSNDDGQWLSLYWRAADSSFVMEGDFGLPSIHPWTWIDGDTLSISMWQSAEARGLTIASRGFETPFVSNIPLAA